MDLVCIREDLIYKANGESVMRKAPQYTAFYYTFDLVIRDLQLSEWASLARDFLKLGLVSNFRKAIAHEQNCKSGKRLVIFVT